MSKEKLPTILIKGKRIVNRSQVIRNYLKTCNRSKSMPKAVAEALSKQGVKVSEGLVSVVKASVRKSKRRMAAKLAAQKRQSPQNEDSLNCLICAKNLLRLSGSMSEAKKNLEIISVLLSKK